jgi:hypothetical protein
MGSIGTRRLGLGIFWANATCHLNTAPSQRFLLKAGDHNKAPLDRMGRHNARSAHIGYSPKMVIAHILPPRLPNVNYFDLASGKDEPALPKDQSFTKLLTTSPTRRKRRWQFTAL